jgi:hypothetical protein
MEDVYFNVGIHSNYKIYSKQIKTVPHIRVTVFKSGG